MTPPGIIIDGASLTCAGVAAVARDEARVTVGTGAVAAARAAWETARDVTARRPVSDSLRYAGQVVRTELNAASENPLVDPPGHAVWHNGNFHAAYAGLSLDSVRAALFQTAALSAARLGTLVEPSFTGLHPFAADAPASSGVMVLEYVAQSAVADLRRFATPAEAGPLRAAFDAATAVLDPRTADRPLDADLTAAEGLLDGYAAFGQDREGV